MRILTLLLLLLMSTAKAQQLKWEHGLFLGGANYQGDLVATYGPLLKETNPAYGGFSRFNVGREWSFRLGIISGHISGSDENFSDHGYAQSRNINFRTRITETAFTLEWEPFGNRRYPKEGGYKRLFSPYFFTGAAYTFWQNGADYSRVPRTSKLELATQDKNNFSETGNFAIPAGGGVKIDLSKYTVLSIEAGLRKAYTDMLDGVNKAGNPENDDWYSFAGITLSRRFGQPDFDRDGIVDKEDACPRLAGVSSAQGCPDADGDGVEDLEDVCPLAFGSHELNGCPDADGDKVIDLHDECPFIAGLEIFNGCPDTDEDGIMDREDQCPEIAGVREERGCPYPDTDSDGIIDKEDECPNIPGVAEENGCPYPDTDADGVIDKEDACPELFGMETLAGCPDADADGIIDPEDRCPNTPGLSDNEGCPEIQEEEQALLRLAMEAVRFETGSAVLKPSSLQILDQISEILAKYPDYDLRVSGHTDNRGNDQANLILSKKRARSCVNYLASTGIDSDRLSHEGFGEGRPISDNDSEQGRQLNRRVEFELFLPEKPVTEIAMNQETEKVQQKPLEVQTATTPADSARFDPIDKVTDLPQSAENQSAPIVQPDSNRVVHEIAGQLKPVQTETSGDSSVVVKPDIPAPLITDTISDPPVDSTQLTRSPERPVPALPLVPGTTVSPGQQISNADPGRSVLANNDQPSPAGLPPPTASTPSDTLVLAKTGQLSGVVPDPGTIANEPDRPKSEPMPERPTPRDTTSAVAPVGTGRQQLTVNDIAAVNPTPATPIDADLGRLVRKVTARPSPDTIYWFEQEAGWSRLDSFNRISLPPIYLQPVSVATDTTDLPVLTKPTSTTKESHQEAELSTQLENEATLKYVPKPLMEQKIDSLERRIEVLEKRILLLEQWIINQDSTILHDIVPLPHPAKEEKAPKTPQKQKEN